MSDIIESIFIFSTKYQFIYILLNPFVIPAIIIIVYFMIQSWHREKKEDNLLQVNNLTLSQVKSLKKRAKNYKIRNIIYKILIIINSITLVVFELYYIGNEHAFSGTVSFGYAIGAVVTGAFLIPYIIIFIIIYIHNKKRQRILKNKINQLPDFKPDSINPQN